MALNKEILEELKNKLLEEKARLEEELGVIGKPTDNVGDYETKFDDLGRDKEDNASEVDEYADNVWKRQIHLKAGTQIAAPQHTVFGITAF